MILLCRKDFSLGYDPLHGDIECRVRYLIQQQRMQDDARTDAFEFFQEAIEIASTVSQPPAETVEREPGHERQLYLFRRYDRRVGRGFRHAKGMTHESPRVIWMEDHAMILFGDNARQDPSLLRVTFQQRCQICFGFDGHVGENSFASLEDGPVLNAFANGQTRTGTRLFAKRFAERATLLAQLGFLFKDGRGHGDDLGILR